MSSLVGEEIAQTNPLVKAEILRGEDNVNDDDDDDENEDNGDVDGENNNSNNNSNNSSNNNKQKKTVLDVLDSTLFDDAQRETIVLIRDSVNTSLLSSGGPGIIFRSIRKPFENL